MFCVWERKSWWSYNKNYESDLCCIIFVKLQLFSFSVLFTFGVVIFVLHFCSVDEQVAKDIQLIDSIAEKQAQIFSEECKLFPADVQIQSIYPLYEFLSPLYPKYKLIYCVFDSILLELPKTTLFLFIEYF